LIIKIYDSFFDITNQILMLLTFYYQTVSINKPHTSRPANSERYLVCKGFKGIEEHKLQELQELLELWTKSESEPDYLSNKTFLHSFIHFSDQDWKYGAFVESIKASNQHWIDVQISKIDSGMEIYNKMQTKEWSDKDIEDIKTKQVQYAALWCEQYKIPYLWNIFIKIEDQPNLNSK
jgi:hypothetical protein